MPALLSAQSSNTSMPALLSAQSRNTLCIPALLSAQSRHLLHNGVALCAEVHPPAHRCSTMRRGAPYRTPV